MHPALQISEILRTIFRWCDKRSNVSNAVVCRSWQNDGLDLVWEEINDIQHIFKFLGPVAGNPRRFSPPLNYERWNLFRERYAWRVRKLIDGGRVDSSHYPLLDTIARLQDHKPVFPNLKWLVWRSAIGRDDGYGHQSLILMHPNVEKFELSITQTDVPSEVLRQYIHAVSERMPRLKNFHMTMPKSAFDGVAASLASLLKNLPELEFVSLPALSDPSHLLLALASRPRCMKYLDLTRDYKDLGAMQMTSLTRPSVLRDLQHLSIAVSYQTFSHFIRECCDSLPRLTKLSVSSTSPHPEAPSALKDLLESVAGQLPLIKHLELGFSREFPPDLAPSVTMANIVHFLHIEPILACTGITHFHIVHPYPLAVEHNELERIALAWPTLRSLTLSDDPKYPDVLLNDPGWPILDLGALLPFTRHCIYIEELHLCVKPVFSGDDQDVQPLRSLTRLSPGGQRCEGGYKEILDVAIFLSQLLPLRCKVEFESQWLSAELRKKWDESWSEVMKGRLYIEELNRRKGEFKRWRQLSKVEG
ncbi:hypothetical protein AAF712_014393 [Marasmius tenuissimus]|uniref:F-box domain-containing protein n=1 Tax=Marasmius tenuissimus TaxID=585030 RepID=A0ABR2ZB82_9AGAR